MYPVEVNTFVFGTKQPNISPKFASLKVSEKLVDEPETSSSGLNCSVGSRLAAPNNNEEEKPFKPVKSERDADVPANVLSKTLTVGALALNIRPSAIRLLTSFLSFSGVV